MKRGAKIYSRALFLSLSLLFSDLVAHEGDNEKDALTTQKEIISNQRLALYKEINDEYLKKIKPIVKKKCFDCHSDKTVFPWYYKIPGIKQMIDYDIKKAKRHIEMSKDFPFISHNIPIKDLEALREVAIENEMPPLRYVIAHWDSRLTKEERESIIKWSEESISKLRRSGR